MVEKGINKKYYYSLMMVGITFLLILLGIFAIIRPLYKSAKSLTTESKQKTENLNYLRNKKQKLEALKGKEEQLKKDAEVVANALPEEEDLGRLYIEFDELVKSSGATLKGIGASTSGSASSGTAMQTQISSDITRLTYSVPVTTNSYFNLKTLLTRSGQALRLLNIDDISIKGGGEGLEASLTFVTFMRK